jgi:hypothetical protein
MLRKGALSTAERLQAANAEVLRLQEKLKQENSAPSSPSKRELPTPAHASSTCDPRDIQKVPNRSQCHNPLRQAVMITAAFAGSLVLFHQFSAHP